MKQRIRAFVAIDEGGRYVISGGTNMDDGQHIQAVQSMAAYPGTSAYDGLVSVYAIEVEVPTPRHTFIAEVAGLLEMKSPCDGDHAAPRCADPQCWRV